ncbi:uncharacterized protein LOC130671450 [Microplitis mediator]|uniref:uncharacterized protein LOC130671450 n=1 Tax=Microplitis mediator TaxID=375433 RepID=UPI002555365F|nr:uncharacterized protein LOC130671450 [Microplitis mediator]XP_057331341.1 uncharacterized protein LOC130671450 [Microplitis mediator]
MYYNYIDMMYGNFSSPGIRFAISGIHVPESKHPSPCLGYTNPNSTELSSSSIDSVDEFTKKEKKFFNLTSHTVVVVMTQRNVYSNTGKNVPPFLRTAIVNYHKACSNYEKPSIFFSSDVDFQTGHSNFLSEFYSIFMKNNFRYNLNDTCSKYMDNYRLRNLHFPRPWPSCVIYKYSYFFRTYDCSHIKTT